MKDKTSEIRKLEAEAARVLKLRQRHDAHGRQLAAAEKSCEEAIETVILSTIRAAGLTKLPLSELLDDIMALGQAAGKSDVGESLSKNEDDYRALHPECGGSDFLKSMWIAVGAKSSSNLQATRPAPIAKRWRDPGTLEWQTWRVGGNISIAATEILRESLGDRLAILLGADDHFEG